MKKLLLSLSLFLALFASKSQVLNTAFCQTPGTVNAVAVDSVNNIVYVGGNFTSFCGSPRQRIAAMNLTTGALLPWNPGANADVYSLYVHNGSLYAGGFFTTIGGQPHNRIAKFTGPTGPISTWNPNVTSGNYVNCIVGKGNKIYFGGDILLTVGTGKNVAEVDTGTAAPTSWADYPNNTVLALAIDGNSLYVGGVFTQVGATTQSFIAKYNLGGSTILTAWNPNLDGGVQALCAKSGTLYAGGAFTFVGIDNRDHIAELDTALATATGWNPGANNDVFDLEYKNGILYALGNVSVFGGVTENFIGALDVTSNTATSWNALITSSAFDAAIAGTNIYIGGGLGSVLGQPRAGFAVICINPIDPNIAFPNGVSAVCTGLAGVSYSVAPVNGATSYVWYYSGTGATINGSTNAVTIDFSAGATSGGLAVYATNGCQSSSTSTLSINAYAFALTPSGNGTIVCGDSTNLQVFDNYSGAGSVTYTWTPSTGLNNTSSNNVMSGAKSSVDYTITATSTEGCSAGATHMITVNPIAITLTASFSGNIQCSTSDTIVATNNYPGAGLLTYTWSPSATLSFVNPAKAVASPLTSTAYSVNASTGDGCVASEQTLFINVTPITVFAGATQNPITCGNFSGLNAVTDYQGSGALTYTWSPASEVSNPNVSNPSFTPTVSATYTVDITTPEGCVSSGTIFVAVDPLVVTTTGSHTTTCGQAVAINTNHNSGSPVSYTWTPSAGLGSSTASGPLASPNTTTIYTVTISIPGCTSATAVDTVKVLPPATPNICEVTSDSSSTYNILYWDKTPYNVTDSFIVYRETTTNTYTRIGAVPHAALSEYTDTARSIGPANGDPNVGTYRYKMAVKDSCGNVSALSPYHNSVYFIDLQTGTFTWNLYAVENQTTPVTQFNLLRDNLNNGVWIIIGTVTGTQTTLNDPQYSTHQGLANWRVEAQGFNCTPTSKQANGIQGAVVKSKSNITNNRVIGIKNNALNAIGIYPNPNNGNFVIDFGNMTGKVSIKVISLLGEEVYSANVSATDKLPVDMSAYQNGVYVVQINNNSSIATKRIIKN